MCNTTKAMIEQASSSITWVVDPTSVASTSLAMKHYKEQKNLWSIKSYILFLHEGDLCAKLGSL
jgi:hypothetical protein